MSDAYRARLRAAMASRGLKPRTLSVRAGLNPEHVRQFLKGDSRSTTVETTQRLAAALGVEPSWLVGGDAPAATPVPDSGPLAFASALTLRRYLEDIDLASIRAIRETLVTAGLATPELLSLHQRAEQLQASLRWRANDGDD